jgi:predicted Zn-dependent protease
MGLLFCCALLFGVCATAQAQGGGGVIRDEEIEQDLKTFMRPVFREAGVSPSSVRFIILENNELNAFVAGGQNIFLHTGLIIETRNVDELVGVMAHETGHIAHGDLIRARQTAEHISVESLVAEVLGIAAAIGAKSGDAAMAVTSATSSIGLRAFLTHSREQETAADQAGVSFLQGARLPISGFLSFLEKMESQELLPASAQSEYVRTHPLTQDRVNYLQSAYDQERDHHASPPEWAGIHARIKAKLLGYLFPDRALQDQGNSLASRYGRAIAYYRKTEMKKALDVLNPLIAENPQDPYFYELKGQILFENGKVDEALPAYAKAVEFAPQSGLIRAAYGHALLESTTDTAKHEAEAVKQLETSLQTEPLQPQTHHMLAIAYGKSGKEGISRLHLAEEGLLQNKPELAIREAKLAQAALPKGTPSQLRASDIIDAARKNAQKMKGH